MDWLVGSRALVLVLGAATACGGIEGSPIGTAGQNTEAASGDGEPATSGADEVDTGVLTGPPADPSTTTSGGSDDGDDGTSTGAGPLATTGTDTDASDSGASESGTGSGSDSGSSDSGSSDSGSTTAEEG